MSKKHKKKFQKQKRAQLLSQLAQAEGISSEPASAEASAGKQKSMTSEQQTTPAQSSQPQPTTPSPSVTQPSPIIPSPHTTVTDLTSQSYIPFVISDIKKIAILVGALVVILIALFFLDQKFDFLLPLAGKISILLHIRTS
jgi:hypothetical protein